MYGKDIEQALLRVGELLHAEDESVTIVIIGGAALNILGVTNEQPETSMSSPSPTRPIFKTFHDRQIPFPMRSRARRRQSRATWTFPRTG